MAETPNNTFESYNHGGRNVNGYVNGEKVTIVQGNFYAAGFPTSSTAPSSGYDLSSIQRTLREIYSQSFCEIAPFSLPFFFDIEEKWVNLTLKLEGDSTVTDDYADLFKQTFANIKMLIVEGDPGVGKTSLMQRLAYEWSQSRLSDYDLVLYIELRKLREYEFKDIRELIARYMKGYLDEEDSKVFDRCISDTKWCQEHNILVLLDGYDESSMEKQCQELSDFFSSAITRPLCFNVLITSRKGYLSKYRNQPVQKKLRRRFIFVDIIGFTTESQRKEYISKYFDAANDIELSETRADVTHNLNTNANLKGLSVTPLLLTIICLLHKKLNYDTEIELYMNIIWCLIDRHQRKNPQLDVPRLFDFQYDASDKFHVIENSYQHFPQIHLLGKMAMHDIFKKTFTETDLKKFQLKEIVQEVGFLKKEVTRDASNHIKVEYSFLHRTVQEFIMALTFFFSNEEPTEKFCWYLFHSGRYMGYGIIQAEIQTFLNMIYCSKIKIKNSRKNKYSQLIKQTKSLPLPGSHKLPQISTIATHSQQDSFRFSSTYNDVLPQSQEEAIELVRDEANKDDTFAQYLLGLICVQGLLNIQSDKEAVKWFSKSADQGNAIAQNDLGDMYLKGRGVPQSDEEAVKLYIKSAEHGFVNGQYNLGDMYLNGRGVPQSNEEAIKWFRTSAGQGNTIALNRLCDMYLTGKCVPQSDEEAVKWLRKAADQGNVIAINRLVLMYYNNKSVTQSDEETVKWFRKPAEQGNAAAQNILGDMYSKGRGVPQSDEEAVKLYIKSAEQGFVNGQYNLGDMYLNGRGVPQSNEEAVKWFRKSSDQGNKIALNCLVRLYYNRRGLRLTDEEAVKWFRKPAEQGNAAAQNILGDMYLKGRGVPQSDEEAVKLYIKSAEQGFVNGQCNLGEMYLNGRGVTQSDEEAVKWFRKSAEQDNAIAHNYLIEMSKKAQCI